MKNIQIAPLDLVNARLEEARKQRDIRPDELMPMAGASRATWYSWMNGREGSAVQLCTVGALLGKTPNELLLVTEVDAKGDLDASQIAALEEIRVHCIQITQMTAGKKKPAVAIAAMLREVIEDFEPIAEVPAGTTVEKPEPGVKVYIPPTKSKSTNERTAEGKQRYGKRK